MYTHTYSLDECMYVVCFEELVAINMTHFEPKMTKKLTLVYNDDDDDA